MKSVMNFGLQLNVSSPPSIHESDDTPVFTSLSQNRNPPEWSLTSDWLSGENASTVLLSAVGMTLSSFPSTALLGII
jgi:hypothetical protein